MNSHTKYIIFGPVTSLKQMGAKLFKSLEPKFLHHYTSTTNHDEIFVAVFEEYDKQINSSITLTVVFEKLANQNNIHLKKTGGRMGFRGSAMGETKSIETEVIDFIFDYTKRFGLTIQEENVIKDKEEE